MHKCTTFLSKSQPPLDLFTKTTDMKKAGAPCGGKAHPPETPVNLVSSNCYFSSLMRMLRNFTGEPCPKKPIYPFLLNNPGCS